MESGRTVDVLRRRAVLSGVAGLLVFVGIAAVPGQGHAGALVYSVLAGGAVAVLAGAAARAPQRAPWVLLGAGAAILVACHLLLMWSGTGYDPTAGRVSLLAVFRDHPGLAAAGLVAYPLLYAGQMVLLRQRVGRLLPSSWLDGVLVSAVLAAVAFAFAVPPLVEHLDVSTVGALALVARPLLDLLMTSFALANWSMSGGSLDRRLPLLAAAFAVLTAADTAGILQVVGLLHASTGSGAAVDAGRLCALLLLATAALTPATGTARHALGTESWSHLAGPGVALLGSLTLLGVDQARPLGVAAVGMLLAALALVGLKFVLVFREVLLLSDSRRQALTDDLTGLANRRALRSALETAVAGGGHAVLLLLDLDRFKDVNDRYGHASGDVLLLATAVRLQEQLPPTALLARLGGDEFAVLLPTVDLAAGRALAEHLVATTTAPLLVHDRLLSAAASIGVAATPDPSGAHTSAQELLRRADTAMYRAKRAGIGADVYDGAADTRQRERAELLEDLRKALDVGATGGGGSAGSQIVAYYQPQVHARTGAVVGAEALVRWHHPSRGVLTPDVFLELVEEHGLMAALTTQVLHQAVSAAAGWRHLGHRLRVSVNLSTSCLVNPELLVLVDDVLSTTGVDPSELVLEITETTLMQDPARALRTAHALTARGIGLSIDDYGTGYSSMAYLDDLPATELKLDRSFTARMQSPGRTSAIVATTIDLAHRLGMRVVAEGVEDTATLQALRDLGCDDTQGYLHSRPLSHDHFTSWLTSHTGPPRLPAPRAPTAPTAGAPPSPRHPAADRS